MNRHGLYAQLGFEYQKLVFVYFLLNIGKSNQITYEGCDDVEITADYFPLFKVYDDTNPNTFIQVKSGDVDKSILQRVFMNWLLILDRNKEYTLFLEKSISIDYQEVGFIDELIEGIIKTAKRKNAIIRQVKDKYIGRIDELREDLTWIINNFRVENNSIIEIREKSYRLYQDLFSRVNDNEIIIKEQFEDFLRAIRSGIADKILLDLPFTLTWRELFNIIEDTRNRINETTFDITYSEFKPTSEKKVLELLSKNGGSVKQLKLITNDTSRMIDFLTEQIFYEDFKSHFETLEKVKEISNLEYSAYSNYRDAVFELEDSEFTPKELFVKTTNKELRSPLFMSESSNIRFYSRGCYIHLTDDDIDNELKIAWGSIDEK